MNENINLCEILKGLEGIELYSTIHGKVILEEIDEYSEYPIIVVKNDKISESYTNKGFYNADYAGECTIFPSKEQRDWSKFERPILKDTPMMCLNDLEDSYPWTLQQYSEKRNNKHYVKHYNIYTRSWIESPFKYIIPFDKFNPNNIKESLKYNIQK